MIHRNFEMGYSCRHVCLCDPASLHAGIAKSPRHRRLSAHMTCRAGSFLRRYRMCVEPVTREFRPLVFSLTLTPCHKGLAC